MGLSAAPHQVSIGNSVSNLSEVQLEPQALQVANGPIDLAAVVFRLMPAAGA
jgi:hypothetical protein